jgi:putative chitinase
MIDKKKFFSEVRKSFGKLDQSQVEGFEAILDEWEADDTLVDLRWLAYMLATAWHETAHTMQALCEYGRGKGKKYGKPDPKTGEIYFGRGLVQLTWAANYKKMADILAVDLYEKPALALDLHIAVMIMFEGMLTRKSFKGDFTGKSLENYFNQKVDDPIGARRIINGTDRAETIAGYHKKFLAALNVALV